MALYANTMLSLESSTYLTFEDYSSQTEDYILDTLQTEFARLQEAILENKLTKSPNILKHSLCKSILERIETLVVERFGVQIKFAAYNDERDIFRTLLLPPTSLDINKIDFSNKDVQNDLLKELDHIEDSWNLKGVNVDNDKIRITGLPKDYDIIILSNFTLMTPLDMTDVDMAILLINEIGKIFHYIRLSYNPLRETKEFCSQIRNLIENKNMDAKRAIVTAYSNVTKDNRLALDDSNVLTTTLVIMRKYTSYVTDKIKDFGSIDFVGKFTLNKSDKVNKYIEDRKGLYQKFNDFVILILTSAMLVNILYIVYLVSPHWRILVKALKALGIVILLGFLLSLFFKNRDAIRADKNESNLEEIKNLLKSQTQNLAISTIPKEAMKKLSNIKSNFTNIFNGVSSFSSSVIGTITRLATAKEINKKELDTLPEELDKESK